jgi:CRISPR type I-E-associated protein CasB/Cse2
MARETIQVEAKRTVEFLERIREDRGALAALRCHWISARETQAWPVLARIGGLESRTKQEIAGLYALHPAHTEDREDGNMGAVCATLANKHSTFDLRFRRLLACNREELPLNLRRIVMAAAANELPIDYTELYRDVQLWSDWVRRRWAKNYYRRYQPTEEREG